MLALLFAFGGVATASGGTVYVEIRARGEVVLKGEYAVNPSIKSNDIEVIRESGQTYGETALLDYVFGDLGSKVQAVYEDLDNVSVEDCVTFIPKSREKFVYDLNRSKEWVVRGEVLDKMLDGIDSGHVEIDLNFFEGKKRYTLEVLRGCTEEIATFSTEYAYSSEGRKVNVATATAYINGTVIKGGGRFSFNSTVGARTKERGFREAKVIVDGSYVDGVGGGVCQVASTLYNTAIRANMQVDECTRHTLAPSYVPLSFDAMVSEWADLSLTNTSDCPLFVEAKCDGVTLSVTMYGKKSGKTLKFESIVKEVVRHELYDGTNGHAYRNGYRSEGYKLVYEGEKLVERLRIRKDYYKPYAVEQKREEKVETPTAY